MSSRDSFGDAEGDADESLLVSPKASPPGADSNGSIGIENEGGIGGAVGGLLPAAAANSNSNATPRGRTANGSSFDSR